MSDRAVPNLPSRDFGATERFYGSLGFETVYRSDEWLILRSERSGAHTDVEPTRHGVELEFFPAVDLSPDANPFMCSVRLDDLDAFIDRLRRAGVGEEDDRRPRLTPPVLQPWGRRVAFLIDPDGTQLHLIANAPDGTTPD